MKTGESYWRRTSKRKRRARTTTRKHWCSGQRKKQRKKWVKGNQRGEVSWKPRKDSVSRRKSD